MRAFETEKTDVAEVDRSIYDIKDKPNAAFEVHSGLTPEIVEKISEEKNDPEWMRIFRQKSLRVYNSMPVQNWGPSIEGLDMSNIVTYVRPKTEMRGKWSEVPDDIKNTFERLGIPKAERASLAGVGAQYDSEVVYHNVKAEVAAQGVVYTDIESALNGPYAEMVRTHFMKLVPPTDHKFAALHGAVNFQQGDGAGIPRELRARTAANALHETRGTQFHQDLPHKAGIRLQAFGNGLARKIHIRIQMDENHDVNGVAQFRRVFHSHAPLTGKITALRLMGKMLTTSPSSRALPSWPAPGACPIPGQGLSARRRFF